MTIMLNNNKFEISASANTNHRNCRNCLILNIFDKIKQKALESEWTVDDYLGKKKEMVTALKEWDKLYNLHMKSINPELTMIIDINMKPLAALMKSNYDFYNINRMIEKEAELAQTVEIPVEERIPRFRVEPLEREWIKDYSEICRILTVVPGKKINEKDTEPTAERYQLNFPYDIKQMMEVLKVERWSKIPPFEFYFTPLANAIKASQTELYEMYKRGKLLVKYEIPLN